MSVPYEHHPDHWWLKQLREAAVELANAKLADRGNSLSSPSDIASNLLSVLRSRDEQIDLLKEQLEGVRVQRWHTTYNAAINGLLATSKPYARADIIRYARDYADKTHGAIE